ncbi:MAG: adenylate cyclase [Paraglaciecola psychrophila]|jgi:adenylate cyclase
MAINTTEFKQLAGKICSEIELAQAGSESSSGAGNAAVSGGALRARVEALLIEHDRQDTVPITRRVTILISDIRGFTALAETYSAITVMNMLNRYFASMTEIIVRCGGTIDKLMGDSIMALFGVPLSSEHDEQQAVLCAVEMQRAMSALNEENKALGLPEIFMGIGINTGQVMAGALGSDYHREYTVIGDEVNLASRIEAQSLRGQVLISNKTYALVQDFVTVGEPSYVQVKGKREPVCLYELVGITKPRPLSVPRREIRKSPRVAIDMPCYFQCLQGKSVLEEQLKGGVVDLSYNGLSMYSAVALAAFSEIKMAVSLQLLGTETTSIYARVLKSEPCAEGVLCSLEFTSMDIQGQKSIKSFVDARLVQQR